MIPKPDGSERPLGIPTLKDRVVQTAVKLILEPIFEADFEECSSGMSWGLSLPMSRLHFDSQKTKQQGKPNGGKPHVRFDKGEPSRQSGREPLYSTQKKGVG